MSGQDAPPGAASVDRLLPRIARGDEAAFAAACDQLSGGVYGLVSQILPDPAAAEQVAAQVLLEVWRTASRFRPAEGSGVSWVMTMARRCALGQARGASVGRPAGSPLGQHAFASLPGAQREAVLLAWSGYSRRQVADQVGVSAVTVAGWLRDALLEPGGRARPTGEQPALGSPGTREGASR